MKYVIETKDLTKKFGTQLGVNRVNMKVEEGQIYGLLGRNGAGKTTTMRMLLNLSHPTCGEILLFGEDYLKNCKQTYRRIGSLLEIPGFYENLTGAENLRLLARLRGTQKKDAVEKALHMVGLGKEYTKMVSNYSLGMKQRLAIAAAVMHEPELLILDEPINGLDPVGIHEIRSYLEKLCREKGTTILISSHILSEIEQIADTIGVMHEGKLLEEVTMAELHKRNRQYVEFQVSNENKACRLLEEEFQFDDYSVHENGNIRLYSNLDLRASINLCFNQNGIEVTKVNLSEEKLEDYFSKLIGDGSIG